MANTATVVPEAFDQEDVYIFRPLRFQRGSAGGGGVGGHLDAVVAETAAVAPEAFYRNKEDMCIVRPLRCQTLRYGERGGRNGREGGRGEGQEGRRGRRGRKHHGRAASIVKVASNPFSPASPTPTCSNPTLYLPCPPFPPYPPYPPNDARIAPHPQLLSQNAITLKPALPYLS